MLSHCLNPFCLSPDTDHIQEKVGALNIIITAGREKPATKEPPKDKNPSTTREHTQIEERANLEDPDKETKGTTPLHLIQFLPEKFILQTQLANRNIRKCTNKQKESPKMRRQKKNMQSKGMEDSPLKELNEMEVIKYQI